MTTARQWVRSGSAAPAGSKAGICIQYPGGSITTTVVVAGGNVASADPSADASCNSSQVAEAVPGGDAVVITTTGAGAG